MCGAQTIALAASDAVGTLTPEDAVLSLSLSLSTLYSLSLDAVLSLSLSLDAVLSLSLSTP